MILRTQSNNINVILLIGRRRLVFKNIKSCLKYLGVSNRYVRDICFGRKYNKKYRIYFYEHKDKPFKVLELLVKDCYINKRMLVHDTLLTIEAFSKVCAHWMRYPNLKNLRLDLLIGYKQYFYDSIETILKMSIQDLFDQLLMITSNNYRTKIDFLYTLIIQDYIKKR